MTTCRLNKYEYRNLRIVKALCFYRHELKCVYPFGHPDGPAIMRTLIVAELSNKIRLPQGLHKTSNFKVVYLY